MWQIQGSRKERVPAPGPKRDATGVPMQRETKGQRREEQEKAPGSQGLRLRQGYGGQANSQRSSNRQVPKCEPSGRSLRLFTPFHAFVRFATERTKNRRLDRLVRIGPPLPALSAFARFIFGAGEQSSKLARTKLSEKHQIPSSTVGKITA